MYLDLGCTHGPFPTMWLATQGSRPGGRCSLGDIEGVSAHIVGQAGRDRVHGGTGLGPVGAIGDEGERSGNKKGDSTTMTPATPAAPPPPK